MGKSSWSAYCLLVLALAGLAAPLQAWGHAQLMRSTPANLARLSTAPSRVDLWFDERLDSGSHTVRIIAVRVDLRQASAEKIAKPPRVDPVDPSHLTLDLPPLPAGHYVIEWRVQSMDGHTAAGRITFDILAAH